MNCYSCNQKLQRYCEDNVNIETFYLSSYYLSKKLVLFLKLGSVNEFVLVTFLPC